MNDVHLSEQKGAIMATKQDNFINSVVNGAIEGWKTYRVLPSITISQAILESGWGTSGLTMASNNLFGIKASGSWTGATIKYPTKEYVNGKYVDTNAFFRKYSSRDESMVDHGKFLAGLNRYSKVIGETNYIRAANALQSAGYATSPTYAESLVNLIIKYKLYQYDEACINDTINSVTKLYYFHSGAVTKGDKDKFVQLAESLRLTKYSVDE